MYGLVMKLKFPSLPDLKIIITSINIVCLIRRTIIRVRFLRISYTLILIIWNKIYNFYTEINSYKYVQRISSAAIVSSILRENTSVLLPRNKQLVRIHLIKMKYSEKKKISVTVGIYIYITFWVFWEPILILQIYYFFFFFQKFWLRWKRVGIKKESNRNRYWFCNWIL